ncbi:PaaI family thioesterase [Nocardia yamanashiensis]|uniref:PaaI family thioesterase n=1 Tax=Nocardia yamanashiensis TaxID=209247 RepID=UPI00082A9B65|nr:PaaI family thioesterase [Nocardia yamanashiensis]
MTDAPAPQPLPLGDRFAEGPFPPHHPGCFGCGPANPASPRITFQRQGNLVKGTFTLDLRHQGAPGVAHGGILAAALDEASGAVLVPLQLPAVTAKLDVTYSTPARLHRELQVTSHLVTRTGRKLFIHAAITDNETPIASADALFIEVPPTHFLQFGATPGELPSVGV